MTSWVPPLAVFIATVLTKGGDHGREKIYRKMFRLWNKIGKERRDNVCKRAFGHFMCALSKRKQEIV